MQKNNSSPVSMHQQNLTDYSQNIINSLVGVCEILHMLLFIQLFLSCVIHLIIKGEKSPGISRKLNSGKLNTDKQEIH